MVIQREESHQEMMYKIVKTMDSSTNCGRLPGLHDKVEIVEEEGPDLSFGIERGAVSAAR